MDKIRKHKKLSVFILFLTTYVLMLAATFAAILPRVYADTEALSYQQTYPGKPFPSSLQHKLADGQSWVWAVLAILIVATIAYFLAKFLKITHPFRTILNNHEMLHSSRSLIVLNEITL